MRFDPDRTPPARSTLERWSVFKETSLFLQEFCEKESAACRTIYEKIDLKRSRRLKEIAKEAEGLAEAFDAWQYADPGGGLRKQAMDRLLSLREEVRGFGYTLIVPYERT